MKGLHDRSSEIPTAGLAMPKSRQVSWKFNFTSVEGGVIYFSLKTQTYTLPGSGKKVVGWLIVVGGGF